MLVDSIFTPGLAQVAYMVADEEAGEAAIIDPRRDVEAYEQWASDRRIRIVAILETHVHADFVSGALELSHATGAPIYASRTGESAFDHVALDDGDSVSVGRGLLKAFWTPGHTPEHMSFLLFEEAEAPHPVALFSGDALFVGEVGRPDLLGAEATSVLAEQLYETIHRRLSELPDDVIVYPGHTAGSSCGKKIGDAPNSTIGAEKRGNYAFQARTLDAFVATVLDGIPMPPTYYPFLKRINKEGATATGKLADGHALSPAEVIRCQQQGALLVDARTPEAFGQGHIPGAIFAGLGPNFSTWLGWMAPYDRDVLLVLSSDEQYLEARIELRRIGIDRTVGYLKGGMAAWEGAGHHVGTLEQISVHDLAAVLDSPVNQMKVLDVRSDQEWGSAHINGANHRFAGEIATGAPVDVDQADRVAVICGSGYRSSFASGLLLQQGFDNLVNATGGMDAWNDAQLPTTKSLPARG